MVLALNLRQLVYFITFLVYSVSANKQTNHRNCFQNFNQKIQKCLDPFSQLFRTYQQTQDESSFSNIVKKHICFEYEKMLLCMHSTLTHCPTLRNIKKVQEKLSADWVNNVNGLCRIPSTPKSESQKVEPQRNSILRNYETQTVRTIVRKPVTKNEKNNKVPEMWDVIEAKDKILEKQEAEMWQKLKNTLRQRMGIMKRRLRIVSARKSSSKGDNYNVYNVYYNSMPQGLSVPSDLYMPNRIQIRTKLASQHLKSGSNTYVFSVSILSLCFGISMMIGLH